MHTGQSVSAMTHPECNSLFLAEFAQQAAGELELQTALKCGSHKPPTSHGSPVWTLLLLVIPAATVRRPALDYALRWCTIGRCICSHQLFS